MKITVRYQFENSSEAFGAHQVIGDSPNLPANVPQVGDEFVWAVAEGSTRGTVTRRRITHFAPEGMAVNTEKIETVIDIYLTPFE